AKRANRPQRPATARLRPCSGVEIGDQPAFVPGNLVAEAELSLFQPAQLKLVEGGIVGHALDRLIEVAVLFTKLVQSACEFGGVIDHGAGLGEESSGNRATLNA